MKKIITLALSVLMMLSVLSLTGCGKTETLKLGLGVESYAEKVVNADGDNNGSVKTATTVAAVLVDAQGKIVKCVIDAGEITLDFTSQGKNVPVAEFKTKYEQGENYGMVAYGGAKKEWFEQVDAFTALIAGKTLEEVKALVATNAKGTDEVINAGCTIYVADFVKAIEKAVANATDSNATAENNLKLAIVTSNGKSKDATDETAGSNNVIADIAAVALDKDNQVAANKSDTVEVIAAYDVKGVATTKNGDVFTSKYEAKENYNMAKYGTDLNKDGIVKEWFEQADAYNNACNGKDAKGIAALAVETGYGVDELQKAGCTIEISGMVKATVKAATVK